MKKVKGLFLAALAAATVFTSCSKDEDEDAIAPVIGAVQSQSVSVNEEVTATVNITAGDGKLTEESVTVTLKEGENALVINGDVAVEEISDGLNVVITHTFAQAGTYTFTIDAVDKDDVAAEAVSFTVTVAGAEVMFDNEVTDGVVWNQAGKGMGAWDLDADAALSSAGTDDASIQNLDEAQVAFTGKFKSENGTSFVKATIDYATASKTAAMAAYDAGTVLDEVTPAQGDVYVAKKDDVYYMILITAVDATAENGENDGNVTFSYKK